jgi:hypothetical protein
MSQTAFNILLTYGTDIQMTSQGERLAKHKCVDYNLITFVSPANAIPSTEPDADTPAARCEGVIDKCGGYNIYIYTRPVPIPIGEGLANCYLIPDKVVYFDIDKKEDGGQK